MSRNRHKSRLNRRLEKQTKRNLMLSVLGILFILFLLIKIGIPLLANFALFLSNPKTETTQSNQKSNFINIPELNPLPEATNSAKLTLSGRAQSLATINLYINNSIVDKADSDKSGKFSFNINLEKGNNKIYTKTKVDNKLSDSSQEFNVLYKNTPPSLNLNSPSDGQQFSGDQNKVNVTGTTDSGVKITVNGFWSIVDQNNNFSYQLTLQNGDNQIKVTAIDNAGNKTEKNIKVKYSP